MSSAGSELVMLECLQKNTKIPVNPLIVLEMISYLYYNLGVFQFE